MTILTCEHGTDTLTAAGGECASCRLRSAVASAAAANVDPRWEGAIGVEGRPTGDGRLIEVGSLHWDLPILLRYVSEDTGAHDGAQSVGLIETITRRDTDDPNVKLLWGTGIIDVSDDLGQEVHRKLGKGTAGGVSMDLDDVTFEVRVARTQPAAEVEFDADADPDVEVEVEPDGPVVVVTSAPSDEITATTDGRVRAATLVQIPAFIEAWIHLVADSDVEGDMPDGHVESEVDIPELVQMYRSGPLTTWVGWADGIYRFLVAAGFSPDQLRWPKGSPFHWGGRWMETPWKVGGAFLDFWKSLFGGQVLTDLGKGWRGSDPRAAQVIQGLTPAQLTRLEELTAPNGSIRKIVAQLEDAGVNTTGEALFKSVTDLSAGLHEVSDLVKVSNVDVPELDHVVEIVDNYMDAGPVALQALLDANPEGPDAPAVDVEAAFSEALDDSEPGFLYDVGTDTYTNSLGYSLVGHDGVYDVKVDGQTIGDTFDVPAEAMDVARQHYEKNTQPVSATPPPVDAPVDAAAAFNKEAGAGEGPGFVNTTSDSWTNSLDYTITEEGDGTFTPTDPNGQRFYDDQGNLNHATFEDAAAAARAHYESGSGADRATDPAIAAALDTLKGYDSVLPNAAKSATMRQAVANLDPAAVEAARAALDPAVWPEGNPVFEALNQIHAGLGGNGNLQGVVYQPVTGHSSSKPLPNPFDALTDEELADAVANATDAAEVADYNRGHIEMWDRVAARRAAPAARVSDGNGGVLAGNLVAGDQIKIGTSGWLTVDKAITFGKGAEMRTYIDAGGRPFTVPANSRVRMKGLEGEVSANVDDTVANILDALDPNSDGDVGAALFKPTNALDDAQKAAMKAIFKQAMGEPLDQATLDALGASPDDVITVTMGGVDIPFDTTPFKTGGDPAAAVVPDGAPTMQDVAETAVVDELVAAMPSNTWANVIAEATLNPKKVRDQLLVQDPKTFADTKLRAMVAAKLVKRYADAREAARKAELGDADLAGWIEPDKGNTIRVANEAQKLLLETALLPHITTGRWQGYGPKGSSQDWAGATVVVDPAQLGRNFATTKDDFDFTGRDFIASDGASMLAEMQKQLGPQYTEADMMLDLEALKGTVRAVRLDWSVDDALGMVELELDKLTPASTDVATQIAAKGGTARAIRRGLRAQYPNWSNKQIFAVSKGMEADYAPYVGLSPDGLRQAAITDVNLNGNIPKALLNVAAERGIDLNSPNAPVGTTATPSPAAAAPAVPAAPDVAPNVPAAPAVPDVAPAVPEAAPDISQMDPFDEVTPAELDAIDSLPAVVDAAPDIEAPAIAAPIEFPADEYTVPQQALDIIGRMSDAELQQALDGWVEERDNFVDLVDEADREAERVKVAPTIAAIEAEQAKRAAPEAPAAADVPDTAAPEAPVDTTPARVAGEAVGSADLDEVLDAIAARPASSWLGNAAMRLLSDDRADWVYIGPNEAVLEANSGHRFGNYDFTDGTLQLDAAGLEGFERDLIDEAVITLDPNDDDTLFIKDTLANGGHWEKGINGWDLIDTLGQYVAYGHIGLDGESDSVGNPDEDTVRLTPMGKSERDNWLAGQAADDLVEDDFDVVDDTELADLDAVDVTATSYPQVSTPDAMAIDGAVTAKYSDDNPFVRMVEGGYAEWHETATPGVYELLNSSGSNEVVGTYDSNADTLTMDQEFGDEFDRYQIDSILQTGGDDEADFLLQAQTQPGWKWEKSGFDWVLNNEGGDPMAVAYLNADNIVLTPGGKDEFQRWSGAPATAPDGALPARGGPITETKPNGSIAFTPSATDDMWALLGYQGEYMGRNEDGTVIRPMTDGTFEVETEDGEIGSFHWLAEAKAWADWKLTGEQDEVSAMATLDNYGINGREAGLVDNIRKSLVDGLVRWERNGTDHEMVLVATDTDEVLMAIDDNGNVDRTAANPNFDGTYVPVLDRGLPPVMRDAAVDAAGYDPQTLGGIWTQDPVSKDWELVSADMDLLMTVDGDGNVTTSGNPGSPKPRHNTAGPNTVAGVTATLDPLDPAEVTFDSAYNPGGGWVQTVTFGPTSWIRYGNTEVQVRANNDGTFEAFPDFSGQGSEAFPTVDEAIARGVEMSAEQDGSVTYQRPNGTVMFTQGAEGDGWLRTVDLAWMKLDTSNVYVAANTDGTFDMYPTIADVPENFPTLAEALTAGAAARDKQVAASPVGQTYLGQNGRTFFSPDAIPAGWEMVPPFDVTGGATVIRNGEGGRMLAVKDGTFTAARRDDDGIGTSFFNSTFAEALDFAEGRMDLPEATLTAPQGVPAAVRTKFTLKDLFDLPKGWVLGGGAGRAEAGWVEESPNSMVRVRVLGWPHAGMYEAQSSDLMQAHFDNLDDAVKFATSVGHPGPAPDSEHDSVVKGVVDPATPLPDTLSRTDDGLVLDPATDVTLAVDPDHLDSPYVALDDDGSSPLFDDEGTAHFESAGSLREGLVVPEDDGGQQDFYRHDGTPLDPSIPAEALLIALLTRHPNKSYRTAKDALKAARRAQAHAATGEFFAVLGDRRINAKAVSEDREGFELDPSEAPLFAELAKQMQRTLPATQSQAIDALTDPANLAGKRLFADTHGLALVAVDADGRIHGPFTIADKKLSGAHGEATEELLRKAVRGGGRYTTTSDDSRADKLADIGLVATHELPDGTIVYRYDPEYVGSKYDAAKVQAAPDLDAALGSHEATRQAIAAQPFHVALDQGEKGDGHIIVTVPDPKNPAKTITKSGPWGLYGANGLIARNVDASGAERFLMVQRSNMVSQGGHWQFPGGAANSNETAEQGAAREMLEELSPPPGWLGSLTKVGQAVTGNPAAPGWEYNTFAVDAPTQFKPKFDYETADAKWLTAQEIADLAAMGKMTTSVGRTVDQTMALFGTPLPAPSAKAKTAAAVRKAGLEVGRGIKDRAAKMLAGLGGSNGAQKWEVPLPDGTVGTFAVKRLAKDWGQQEALASALYNEAGVAAPEAFYDVKTGSLYMRFVDGLSDALSASTAKEDARNGFVADAWLANWDAPVNQGNVAQTRDGKSMRMDNGGALEFRAKGTRKPTNGPSAFDGTVNELDTMRSRSGGQRMYGARGAKPDDWEVAGAQRIVDISDEQIRALVADHGQPDTLADTLISRRDYIAGRYSLTQTPKPEPAQPAPDGEAPEVDMDAELAMALGDSAFDSSHPAGSVAGITPTVTHGLAATGTEVDLTTVTRADLAPKQGTLYDLPMSDGTTKRYAVVDPVSPEQGKRIHLASLLFDEAGIKGVAADFSDADGKVYEEAIPSLTGTASPGDEYARFALDAWLGRIATRTVFDADGNKVVTDFRGYLGMDSKGTARTFGTTVSGLDKFRDGSFSRSPYGTRGGVDDEWEFDSAKLVVDISDARVRELVAQAGLDDTLADTLIKRRDVIAKRYGIIDERSLGAPNASRAAVFDAAETLLESKANLSDADKINYVRVVSAAGGGSSLFDEIKKFGGLDAAFDAAWHSRNPGKPDRPPQAGITKILGKPIAANSRLKANQVTHDGAGITYADVRKLADEFDLSDKAWAAAEKLYSSEYGSVGDDAQIAQTMVSMQRGYDKPMPVVAWDDFKKLVGTTHRHAFRAVGRDQTAKKLVDGPVIVSPPPGSYKNGGRAWGTSIYIGDASTTRTYGSKLVDFAFDSKNATVLDNDDYSTFATSMASIANQISADTTLTSEQRRNLRRVFDRDFGHYAPAASFLGFDATRGNYEGPGRPNLSVLNRQILVTHDRGHTDQHKTMNAAMGGAPGGGVYGPSAWVQELENRKPQRKVTATLAEAQAGPSNPVTRSTPAAPAAPAAPVAPSGPIGGLTPMEAVLAKNMGVLAAVQSGSVDPALLQYIKDATAKFGVNAELPINFWDIKMGKQRIFTGNRALGKGDVFGVMDMLAVSRLADSTQFKANVGRYHRTYILQNGLIYNATTGKPVQWINDIIAGVPGKAAAAIRKYENIGFLIP